MYRKGFLRMWSGQSLVRKPGASLPILIKQQYALCFSSNQTRVLAKVHKWECRIMAITSAFQADDAGSIPSFLKIITLSQLHLKQLRGCFSFFRKTFTCANLSCKPMKLQARMQLATRKMATKLNSTRPTSGMISNKIHAFLAEE